MNPSRKGMVSVESLLLIAVGALILLGLTEYWHSSLAPQTEKIVAVVLGQEEELETSKPDFRVKRPNTNSSKEIPFDWVDDLNQVSQETLDVLNDEFAQSVDQMGAVSQEILDALINEANESTEQMNDVAEELLAPFIRQLEKEAAIAADLIDHIKNKQTKNSADDPFFDHLRDLGVDRETADKITSKLNRLGNDPETLEVFAKEVLQQVLKKAGPAFAFVDQMIQNIEKSKTEPPRMRAERDPMYKLLINRGVSREKAKRVVDALNKIGDDPDTLLSVIPFYGTIKYLVTK